MTRKKTPARKSPALEAETVGINYATEQLESEHFENWVQDQLVEASQMPPEKVLPLETKADAKKIARNMLQQLEWDTKRDLNNFRNSSEIEYLTGSNSEEAVDGFYKGLHRGLTNPSTVDWLAEEILEQSREAQSLTGSRETREPHRVSVATRREIQYELWLCQDCMIAEVNGDLSGLDDERAEEVQNGIERLVEQVGPLSANFSDGEGEEEFTHRRCDACGDSYGGPRYRFASFGKGAREKTARSAKEHSVRDYIAVDRNDRPVAGPFKSQSEAHQHVPPGGYVKFDSKSSQRRRPPAPSAFPVFREGTPTASGRYSSRQSSENALIHDVFLDGHHRIGYIAGPYSYGGKQDFYQWRLENVSPNGFPPFGLSSISGRSKTKQAALDAVIHADNARRARAESAPSHSQHNKEAGGRARSPREGSSPVARTSNMVKIRVTCRNNADARRWNLLPNSRHNGGKLVIVTVAKEDLEAAQEVLDNAHEVSSYTVE